MTTIDRPVTVSEVAASFAFLAGLALGVVTGIALLVLTALRPDDGVITTPPAVLNFFASPMGILIPLAIGMAATYAGRAASEQRGCLPGLAGLALSLLGGLTIALILTIYAGALIMAAAQAAVVALGRLPRIGKRRRFLQAGQRVELAPQRHDTGPQHVRVRAIHPAHDRDESVHLWRQPESDLLGHLGRFGRHGHSIGEGGRKCQTLAYL